MTHTKTLRGVSAGLVIGLLVLLSAGDAWAGSCNWRGWNGWRGKNADHSPRRAYRNRIQVIKTVEPIYQLQDCNVVRRQRSGLNRTVVINIPNDNGSFTPVTLQQENGVYIGPRGEQYLNMPTLDQLKAVYGLDSQIARR
ncbi:MAG: hypothetical protein JW937_00670 [Candidatus Omnitrophica bacterium]|nr:hypothetical protein [Candidatus Omnitrophota bacterium]